MRENTGLERAVSGAHDYARTFGSSRCQPFVQFSISLASDAYSSVAANEKVKMAQQSQPIAIDLDEDGDSLPVISAPAALTATEMTTWDLLGPPKEFQAAPGTS